MQKRSLSSSCWALLNTGLVSSSPSGFPTLSLLLKFLVPNLRFSGFFKMGDGYRWAITDLSSRFWLISDMLLWATVYMPCSFAEFQCYLNCDASEWIFIRNILCWITSMQISHISVYFNANFCILIDISTRCSLDLKPLLIWRDSDLKIPQKLLIQSRKSRNNTLSSLDNFALGVLLISQLI